jgi:hypothetical protein
MRYSQNYLDNFYRIKDVNDKLGQQYNNDGSAFNGNYKVLYIAPLVGFVLLGAIILNVV